MATKTSKFYKQRYELAMASGRDAADRQAKDAGRSEWSDADWELAAQVFTELYHGATA